LRDKRTKDRSSEKLPFSESHLVTPFSWAAGKGKRGKLVDGGAAEAQTGIRPISYERNDQTHEYRGGAT